MTAADRIKDAQATAYRSCSNDARAITFALLAIAEAIREANPPQLCANCRGHHEDCFCG